MQFLVELHNVSKRFALHRRRNLRDIIGSLTGRRNGKRDEFWALREVTFQASRGEVVGLIGRNGAGKSTLLRLIAGIFPPSSGTMEIRGQVAPMLELGTGFHPLLTGRENIHLNGALLGLSRTEISHRLDRIVEYAGLGSFIDLPINQYSSGMLARLGFAVATQIPSDILLVDEVLAVGDMSFRNKCLETMQAFAQEGKLIFFVSHEMQMVRMMCTRTILLDHGYVVADGTPKEVVDIYHALVAEESAAGGQRLGYKDVSELVGVERYGSGEARILEVEVLGSDGKPKRVFESGEPARIRVLVRFDVDLDHLLVGITIRNWQGIDMYMTNSVWQGIDLGKKRSGEVWTFYFDQEMWLNQGVYSIGVAVSQFFGQDRVKRLDWIADVVQFSVYSPYMMGGYANLHSRITAIQD